MATVGDRVQKFLEDTYPHVAGVVTGGLVFAVAPSLHCIVQERGLKIDQAYSGIFGLTTVLTGFLFTFYSFVITTEHGFIGKARSSIYLKQTVSFTITALVAGFVSALASLPMMVWQPELDGRLAQAAFAIWVGFSVWALFAFERAARLFILFTRRHNP
ncbi:hypothetical protein [Brevundimonas diminuta]